MIITFLFSLQLLAPKKKSKESSSDQKQKAVLIMLKYEILKHQTSKYFLYLPVENIFTAYRADSWLQDTQV